jgi:hypothetical protein
MRSTKRITLKDYSKVDEAKAAETLLTEGGIPKDSVARSGKKLRVDSEWESVARMLLEGTTMDETTRTTASGAGSAQGTASATDTVQDVASTAADTAQDAASTVADTAQSVASTAVDTAQSAASTVADTAQQAVSAVGDTVQGATQAVTSRVDRVADAAADKVEDLADTVSRGAMRADAPQVQRQIAETTVNVLDTTAEYLREGDLSMILEDLRSVVRRHPLRSLAVGLGLGYLVRSTFFGGGSAQGGSGSSSRMRPAASPQSRPVPVQTSGAASGYDMATPAPATASPIGGAATVGSGIAGTSADVAIDNADANSLLYGTDATTTAGLSGTGVGTAGDLGTGLGAAGGLSDIGSGTTDVGTTGTSSMGTGTIDDLSSSGTGMTGGTATSGYDDTATRALTEGATGSGDTTDQFRASTMPTDEQLQQWDRNTRGEAS